MKVAFTSLSQVFICPANLCHGMKIVSYSGMTQLWKIFFMYNCEISLVQYTMMLLGFHVIQTNKCMYPWAIHWLLISDNTEYAYVNIFYIKGNAQNFKYTLH